MEPPTGSRPDPTTQPVPFFVSSPPETTTASSFTALLELPPTQALELLHSSDHHHNPTFPVRPDQTVKTEPADPAPINQHRPPLKRKERENSKIKSANGKKGKCSQAEDGDDKLPYVHVRARRGQATDSHSLAERARREKINARMKLLQELVPGCNKISGTALILDEIINHVQHLQRQVEFLSMRIAAINPRIDFNIDNILATESCSLGDSNFPSMLMPPVWPDVQTNMNRQQYQQEWHLDAVNQPVWGREDENNNNFLTPEQSLPSYDSSANSASFHSGQLKMEL